MGSSVRGVGGTGVQVAPRHCTVLRCLIRSGVRPATSRVCGTLTSHFPGVDTTAICGGLELFMGVNFMGRLTCKSTSDHFSFDGARRCRTVYRDYKGVISLCCPMLSSIRVITRGLANFRINRRHVRICNVYPRYRRGKVRGRSVTSKTRTTKRRRRRW